MASLFEPPRWFSPIRSVFRFWMIDSTMAKHAKSLSGRFKTASLRSSIPSVKAGPVSSPRATRSRPKSGRIIGFTLDPNNPPKLTDRDLHRRTKAQIATAAKDDPDNLPLTEDDLKRFSRPVPSPDVKIVRKATGLSQSAFAWRFGFDVTAIRDWEQGRRMPDRAARVLMAVIQFNPKAVEQALAAQTLSAQKTHMTSRKNKS
jgi:putative transcriptional regulator